MSTSDIFLKNKYSTMAIVLKIKKLRKFCPPRGSNPIVIIIIVC